MPKENQKMKSKTSINLGYSTTSQTGQLEKRYFINQSERYLRTKGSDLFVT